MELAVLSVIRLNWKYSHNQQYCIINYIILVQKRLKLLKTPVFRKIPNLL